MNNKIYILGVGTGIILSTLILYIVFLLSFDNINVDDDYVINRATELGMVMIEDIDISTLSNLGFIYEETYEDVDGDINLVEDNNIQEDNLSIENEGNNTLEEINSVDNEGEDYASIENDNLQEVNSEFDIVENIEDTKINVEQSNTNKTDYITFEVVPGSTSYIVSKTLLNKGLIDDENKFNKYLMDNDYSTKIRVGTYRVASDSTYEQLARLLTGR